MLDETTKAAVRDTVERIITGRERVPGDLPYPPTITDHVLLAAWPDEDPRRQQYTKPGRELSRAARRTYVAGWFAGRSCDGQITRQLRDWLGHTPGPHPYIGVGACLVCDGPPHLAAGPEPRVWSLPAEPGPDVEKVWEEPEGVVWLRHIAEPG